MHGLKDPVAWCPHQYCRNRSITPAAAFGGQWLRHTVKTSHAFLFSGPWGVSCISLICLCLVLGVAHCSAINEIKHRRHQ